MIIETASLFKNMQVNKGSTKNVKEGGHKLTKLNPKAAGWPKAGNEGKPDFAPAGAEFPENGSKPP